MTAPATRANQPHDQAAAMRSIWAPLVETCVSQRMDLAQENMSQRVEEVLGGLRRKLQKQLKKHSDVLAEMHQAAAPAIEQAVRSFDTLAERLIRERFAQLDLPRRIDVYVDSEPKAQLSRQHYLFEVVLKMMTARDLKGVPINVALVGPTQTGKSTMAINSAEALGLRAIIQPFNAQTSKAELMGYMAAGGDWVPSNFYHAFKDGGIFIAEEWDTASPQMAILLNTPLANRVATFPNGETVKAHKDFRAVYTMNTYGSGGDDLYTGRSRLDISSLERAITLFVPKDPGLVAHAVGIYNVPSPQVDITEGGRFSDSTDVFDTLGGIERAMEACKLRVGLSGRAVIHACALHEAGFGKKMILETCVWKGLPASTRYQVEKELAPKGGSKKKP